MFDQFQVLGLGILSTSILTLFTPLAAHAGVGVLVALRVLMVNEKAIFIILNEIFFS